MQTEKIVIDKMRARELWRAYNTHRSYSRPIDEEIRRTYKAIARGQIVIKALESIKTAGLGEDGLPKLAICRADFERCVLRYHPNGSAEFSERGSWSRSARGRVRLPEDSLPHIAPPPGERWARGKEATAIVPIVPVHLRPKRGLANYHILWEAEWKNIVPVDPLLLRHLGKGDLWLVVAAWDLTAVEQAALAARLQ